LAAGRKIGEIYGYKALTSADQLRADGKTPFIDPTLQANYEIVEGRVVNKTTKAIYFSDEATSLGDPNPTLTSSFINNITWRNTVSFGFQLDWINGSHLYNQTNEWMYRDGISGDFTKPVTINGRTGAWTAYWSSAYYNLWGSTHGAGNNATKDFFYEDASFLRLRNVSVSFDVAKVVKLPFVNRFQLVLTGRNILTVTKYSGYDPEVGPVNGNVFLNGIDLGRYPVPRTIIGGINLEF